MRYAMFRGGRHPNSESGALPVTPVVITLEYLRLHWGTAYDTWHYGDSWGARFEGDLDADALRATTGRQLLNLIRADYRRRKLLTLASRPR